MCPNVLEFLAAPEVVTERCEPDGVERHHLHRLEQIHDVPEWGGVDE